MFVNIQGQTVEYEILNVCEFNSTRKRMSTVVRAPDGKIKLYCKGADTVILERLGKHQPFTEKTLSHLEVCPHLSFFPILTDDDDRTTPPKVSARSASHTAISPPPNILNGPPSTPKLPPPSTDVAKRSTKPPS